MSSVFNYRSPTVILDDLTSTFSALQPDVALNEASTLYFLFQVFAIAAADNMNLAEDFANAAFMTTATGSDLTALAADRSVTRLAAIPSTVEVTFSRVTTGTVVNIPAGSLFGTQPDSNGDQLVFTLNANAIIASGDTTTTGVLICNTTGVIGNVALNTVNVIISSIPGLDAVNNDVFTGQAGTDIESDAALRTRVITFLQNNTGKVTTTGYVNTLLSFPGVSSAKVYATNLLMPNQITAVVTTNIYPTGIPDGTQLATWTALINSDDNRAVCDIITVIAPTPVTITVAANIIAYQPSADPTTTRARVQAEIISFIDSIPAGTDVKVVDIANIIHDDAGVADFAVTLPVANVTILTSQKAIATGADVTIT